MRARGRDFEAVLAIRIAIDVLVARLREAVRAVV
jgi:hypothetical protein